MMVTQEEVLNTVEGLSNSLLEICLEEGWINPVRTHQGPSFARIDIVRLQLIVTLRHDLDVNDESVPIILALIDQIHGLRYKLRSLTEAVEAQPRDIQETILKKLKTE